MGLNGKSHAPQARGVHVGSMIGANKTEAAYGAELQRRKAAGEILEWWWQPFSLRLCFLEGGRSDYYRPDFMVQLPDGLLEIHETKGFMQDDARTKLKLAASLYPFAFWLVRRKGGAWQAERWAGAFP